jgi:hypothetical protein
MEENKYSFLQNEFRTMSFFIIKGSMAETKKIKTPQDLYRLSTDQESKKPIEVDISAIQKEALDFIKNHLN